MRLSLCRITHGCICRVWLCCVCRLVSLANGCGSWLSYSGVVRVLFPEQLRAVAERLCRCHVIHAVSVLKVSMWGAGVSPGVHRRFSDSATFFLVEKKLGRFVGIFFRKENCFFSETSVLAADKPAHSGHYRRPPDRSVVKSIGNIILDWGPIYFLGQRKPFTMNITPKKYIPAPFSKPW